MVVDVLGIVFFAISYRIVVKLSIGSLFFNIVSFISYSQRALKDGQMLYLISTSQVPFSGTQQVHIDLSETVSHQAQIPFSGTQQIHMPLSETVSHQAQIPFSGTQQVHMPLSETVSNQAQIRFSGTQQVQTPLSETVSQQINHTEPRSSNPANRKR